MVINSGYSHISEPALELHRRATPSVGGNITAQLVLTQGEIPEEGRKKTFKSISNLKYFSLQFFRYESYKIFEDCK